MSVIGEDPSDWGLAIMIIACIIAILGFGGLFIYIGIFH